jgi:crossover junction endodeoxyribonuclease RusA
LSVIELPFPAPALWPNKRAHFMAKAREAKKHRAWARFATLEAKAGCGEGRLRLVVTIHPKTRHAIDVDNCISALKSSFDGVADALGVDDRRFDSPLVRFGEPIKGGLVRIEIAPA